MAFRSKANASHEDLRGQVDLPTHAGATRPDQGPARRAGSVLIGLVLLALKLDAYAHLLSDGRVVLVIILGLAALTGLLRGRPLRTAVACGVIAGVVVSTSSLWVRVTTGFVAVAALVALCVALGHLLQWLDERALT